MMIRSCYIFLRITLVFIILAVFSSGCTNFRALKNQTIEGKDFASYLAKEYQQYALSESEQHRWRNAEFFAAKANKSLKQETVLPEVPFDEQWKLTPEQRSTLTAGREYFFSVIELKNNLALAEDVAQAQIAFDCWLEKSQSASIIEGSEPCRESFFELMDHLTQQLPSKTKAEPISAPNVLEPLSTCTSVIFDFNSSRLNGKAIKTLDIFLKQLKESERDHTLYINGHADRVGSKAYNMHLSNLRIDAVKTYIKKHIKGIKLKYHTKAYGEVKPKLPTADQMKEQVNRRVDIGISEPQSGHCHPL